MAKGRKTGGGSRAGKPNKNTAVKRALSAARLPDDLEDELWDKYLHHDDKHIAWEAFKLAHLYKHGQAPKAPSDKDSGQTIIIQFTRDPETPVVNIPDKPKV